MCFLSFFTRYYEGGSPTSPGTTWKWSLGLARASSPTGPWRKSEENPILNGSAVCDPKREFTGKVRINTTVYCYSTGYC